MVLRGLGYAWPDGRSDVTLRRRRTSPRPTRPAPSKAIDPGSGVETTMTTKLSIAKLPQLKPENVQDVTSSSKSKFRLVRNEAVGNEPIFSPLLPVSTTKNSLGKPAALAAAKSTHRTARS